MELSCADALMAASEHVRTAPSARRRNGGGMCPGRVTASVQILKGFVSSGRGAFSRRNDIHTADGIQPPRKRGTKRTQRMKNVVLYPQTTNIAAPRPLAKKGGETTT